MNNYDGYITFGSSIVFMIVSDIFKILYAIGCIYDRVTYYMGSLYCKTISWNVHEGNYLALIGITTFNTSLWTLLSRICTIKCFA